MQANFHFALLLTTLAGFATLLGGFVTFLIKKNSLKALSVGIAFSTGVMIFIALNELLYESQEYFEVNCADYAQHFAYGCFFIGIILASLVDFFMPAHNNEHLVVDECSSECSKSEIKKAGILTAITVSIHSIPESLATFFVASTNLALGIPMTIAIAIHNIPLGSAVAIPVYHATGKKRLAIFYSFLSSLAGPFGALIGWLFLRTYLNETVIGVLFGLVAGIMIYISLDTLFPLARKYGDNHQVITGIVAGMFFISISLLMLH